MEPRGIGEWESALFSVLGFVEGSPARTVVISAAANEALVPAEARWWSSEQLTPVPATQDPGVASELLATSATLGGLPVTDNTPEGYEAIVDALTSAGDWRYTPQWLLETWHPVDDAVTLTISRAAIAGWADENDSGIVIYVYGGALRDADGLFGTPGPLHSYVLAVTRSTEDTDSVGTAHRVIWSCPGERWCHRGGCPDVDVPELAALLTPIVTAARAAEIAGNGTNGKWAEAYERLYGDGDSTEYADRVLELVSAMLSGGGWVELAQSTWEGGLEQLILRRGQHCLTVMYDPATRQVQLLDGKTELDSMLQLLADDGVLISEDEGDRVNFDQDAVERWGAELLAAADDLLRGHLDDLPQLDSSKRITVLGLHPHGDGDLRGPQAAKLAEHQLVALLRSHDLLNMARTQPHERSNG